MYKILAIDGGGSRGIIPATLLHCLHQDTGINPIEHFDLIAGTSTGGIISIALAAGLTPAQLVDLYLNKVNQIFSESLLDRLSGLDEHMQANYNNKKLKKILEQLMGSKTLKDVHQSAHFGKKGKTLMVCAFDLYPLAKDPKTPDFNYRPHVFNSAYIRDGAETLVDLALRTSAGPTYFPIYQHFVDGGVAMNNPSMAAVAFAMNDSVSSKPIYHYGNPTKKGPGITDRRQIRLLSLGCGTSNSSFISPDEINKRKRGNWGNIQWIKYLTDLLTESNMQSSWYYVQQVLQDNHYHRINVRFTDAKHYPDLLHKVISMDEKDPATLHAMHEFAKDTYQQEKETIFKLLGIK